MQWLNKHPFIVAFLVFWFISSSIRVTFAQYENDTLYDARSSEHKSGANTPREYFIPPTPPYNKTDLKEYLDYRNTYYSPYAQLQLFRMVQIGKTRLNVGYYLVKLSMVLPKNDPNTANRVGPRKVGENTPPDPYAPQHYSFFEKLSPSFWQNGRPPDVKPIYPPINNEQASDQSQQAHASLMIKQKGSVDLAIPIVSSEPAKHRIKNGPIAELLIQPGDPLTPQVVYLKYCVEQICYKTAALTPGLVQ